MKKKDAKEKAQDLIMHSIANALYIAGEEYLPIPIQEELKNQARRVMKFLGYESWPGIG